MAITAALGAAALGAGSSLLNAQNGYSDSISQSIGGSSSWNQGISDSSAYNSAHVYGTEASQADILRAQEANRQQYQNWLLHAKYNSAEAAKNRAWQEEMSNTSYQRAVKDLQAAGLNPILAAMNMGASTGAGATASSGLQTAYKANTYADQDSYGYSNSHSESSGGGSSWEQSNSKSHSETNSQLKTLIDAIADLFATEGGGGHKF